MSPIRSRNSKKAAWSASGVGTGGVAGVRRGVAGELGDVGRGHVRERRHHMCPTSSGISKKVGWR